MEKHKPAPMNASALDEDVIEMLTEAQEPLPISIEVAARMRNHVMQQIKSTHKPVRLPNEVSTLRNNEGKWVEAMPGAYYKVLHNDASGLDGLMSYLIKLEPGVEMEGHEHPFDEECLMLEGDLTLGDITLNKGDFHYASAGAVHGSVSTQKGCIAFLRGALPV